MFYILKINKEVKKQTLQTEIQGNFNLLYEINNPFRLKIIFFLQKYKFQKHFIFMEIKKTKESHKRKTVFTIYGLFPCVG